MYVIYDTKSRDGAVLTCSKDYFESVAVLEILSRKEISVSLLDVVRVRSLWCEKSVPPTVTPAKNTATTVKITMPCFCSGVCPAIAYPRVRGLVGSFFSFLQQEEKITINGERQTIALQT